MVQGLGLTTSELMMARASAIKCAGHREKPTRLLDLTIRFGIDLLTLAPVPKESLQDLRRKRIGRWSLSCQEVLMCKNCQWGGIPGKRVKECQQQTQMHTQLPSQDVWKIYCTVMSQQGRWWHSSWRWEQQQSGQVEAQAWHAEGNNRPQGVNMLLHSELQKPQPQSQPQPQWAPETRNGETWSNENLNSENSLDEAPEKFWRPFQELWQPGYQMKTR